MLGHMSSAGDRTRSLPRFFHTGKPCWINKEISTEPHRSHMAYRLLSHPVVGFHQTHGRVVAVRSSAPRRGRRSELSKGMSIPVDVPITNLLEGKAAFQLQQPKWHGVAKDMAEAFSCPICEIEQLLSTEAHQLEQDAHQRLYSNFGHQAGERAAEAHTPRNIRYELCDPWEGLMVPGQQTICGVVSLEFTQWTIILNLTVT